MELPRIILKCNRFYRAALRKVGPQSIWEHLPAYFKRNRDHLQGELSSIHAFIASTDELTIVRKEDGSLDTSVYIPLNTLRDKYREWKQANDIKDSQKWDKELYTKALIDNGLKPPVRARHAYPRDMTEVTQKTWVLGIDTTAECERIGNIH